MKKKNTFYFFYNLIKNIYRGLSKPKIKIISKFNKKFYIISNDTLSKNKFHEKHFIDLIKILLNKNHNALDLGAHIGMHSVLMSSIIKGGKVFSFECDSLLYSLLQANINNNKIKNISPYKFAVTNKTGDCVSLSALNYNDKSLNTGTTHVSNENIFHSNLTISIKLDDLSLPLINFIKMDIQGSEFLALKGMNKILDNDRPIFFVEIEEFYLNKMGSSSKNLIELFFSKKYTLFRIKTSYPCDHIAVPNEKKKYVKKILDKYFKYQLDELCGKKIELEFGKNLYTYTKFYLEK